MKASKYLSGLELMHYFRCFHFGLYELIFALCSPRRGAHLRILCRLWLSSLVDIAAPERTVARAIADIVATTPRSTSAAIAKKCPDEEH